MPSCCSRDRPSAGVSCYAGRPTGEQRSALQESARIARGEIEDITKAEASQLDAVILPGGFGAVKVLSNFADKGDSCVVDPDVSRLLREMHAAG